MSAQVEADPQGAAPATARACPRCSEPMAPGQDWCLNCGAAVTTRIASPPTWRGPLAAMIGVGLLALAALALAFFALADDDPPATPAQTPTPAATEPAPIAAAPTGAETPAPTGTPDPASTGEPASWPAGRTAWTIVMHATSSRAAAERRAQRLTSEGMVVGVLDSNRFRALPEDEWLVFSGQYDSSRAAAQARQELGSSAPGDAYVRRIVPR